MPAGSALRQLMVLDAGDHEGAVREAGIREEPAAPASARHGAERRRTGAGNAVALPVRSTRVTMETRQATEFMDVTGLVEAVVRDAGLVAGVVTVQTRHTTMGLLVNEHEPLLLEDLRSMFERLAPTRGVYAHDDFDRRTVNVAPGERRNGHAHCRAALLRSSETLAVRDGRLDLGRWQRVFLVEFDGPQRRELALTLMGAYGADREEGGDAGL
jgi:secondary thiamine-phosphate synthase enzyme